MQNTVWQKKQQSLEMETNQSLLHNKSGNGLINKLKASKNTITDLNLVQDGDSTLPPGRRIHLRHHTGNKAATGSQIEAGIRGDHHPSLVRDVISLAGAQSPGDRREVWTGAPAAHHVFSCTVVAVSLQSFCQSVQSHIDLHAPAWLKSRSTLSAFRPQTFTPHPRRAMSYTLRNLSPRTGTPSPPFPESVFQQSEQPCGDQRPQQRGALREIPPLTGYEPNWIAEDRDYRHFTGDGQFTEHEDLRVRPLSFHQSIICFLFFRHRAQFHCGNRKGEDSRALKWKTSSRSVLNVPLRRLW